MLFIFWVFLSGSTQAVGRAVKYFILQRGLGLVLLIGVIKNYALGAEGLIQIFILVILLAKLGLPPFHIWALNLSNYLFLGQLVVLLTVIKVIPLTILSGLTSGASLVLRGVM